MQLFENPSAGVGEGHGCNQTDAFGHVQCVSADVVGVETLQTRQGGGSVQLLSGGTGIFWTARCGWRVQDVVLFCIVHVVERLHGTADLFARHLLKEGEGKAIGSGAVLSRDNERVELGLAGVRLGAEGQALWHAKLWRKQQKTSEALQILKRGN